MAEKENIDMVQVFKALGDERRLHIVELIAHTDNICAHQILDDIGTSQATLSHHMKTLCHSRVVNYRREGKWVFYTLNPNALEAIKAFVDDVS